MRANGRTFYERCDDVSKLFSLKKPCVDCPFRKDGHMLKSLSEGRMEEIVNNVINEDGFFSCHKTIDYSKNTTGITEENKFCAGALIAIEKANASLRNRNTRLALGLNLYHPSGLKDVEEIIEPNDYLKPNK